MSLQDDIFDVEAACKATDCRDALYRITFALLALEGERDRYLELSNAQRIVISDLSIQLHGKQP